MDWLEISLIVDGEQAEAVAELLSRYAENGVTLEQGVRHLGDEDEGSPEGPIRVCAYLAADAQLAEKRQRILEGLHYLGMIQPLAAPTFRPVAEQNWMEAWRQHYRPIRIGRRLTVVPVWLEPADGERIPIRIDPGMAFGTGTHPSTQLCLELLDGFLDPSCRETGPVPRRPEATFIDVGCGSGILSIAALKLGVKQALGVDTDPASIQNARENARINGMGRQLALEQGSVADVLRGTYALKSASLVAVNILAPVIVRLFEEGLAELLEPGGKLILAGILEPQAIAVEAAAERVGLRIDSRRLIGDWVALTATTVDSV